MLLVVDDDPAAARHVRRLLEGAGWRVETFGEAEPALDHSAQEEPELILCDVDLGTTGGVEFLRAYQARFPMRRTPLVFLSDPSSSADMVKALESGADEYFAQPLDPEVFVARVRVLLRRRREGLSARFRGDLSRFSLVQVLQYCEKHKLSGPVRFDTAKGSVSVRFEAGEMMVDQDDDLLAELMSLEEGTFTIESLPVGFGEISDAYKASIIPPAPDGMGDLEPTGAPSEPPAAPAAAIDEPPPQPAQPPLPAPTAALPPLPDPQPAPLPIPVSPDAPPARAPLPIPYLPSPASLLTTAPLQPPMGRLSGIEHGGHMFQLQTEYEAPPVDEIVTIVIVNGRVVKKHATPRPTGSDGDALRALLHEQHTEVEQGLRARLAASEHDATQEALPARQEAQDARQETQHERREPQSARQEAQDESDTYDDQKLFDRGLKKWRDGDLRGALRLLERAERLNPEDSALKACVAAVRRRLAKTARDPYG